MKILALLTVFCSKGQEAEGSNHLQFQYGIAPSIGKHQLETYEYAIEKNIKLWGLEPSLRLAYLHSRFTYFEVVDIQSITPYEKLRLVDCNIGVVKHFSPEWALSARFNPQLASNISGGLNTNDFVFGYGIGVARKWGTKVLSLGVERTTVLGSPRFLPFIHYSQDIGDSVRVLLGFPESSISYQITQRHAFDIHARAAGNYYNIVGEHPIMDIGTISESKLRFSSFLFSLGHQYRIQPNVTAISQIGLQANNTLEVENSDGNTLYAFDTKASIQFSMGLRFNLNKSKND